jgi:large subunit ribosomal protein L24
MAAKMKIKKGDLVQILSGKDRVKPIRDSSRMGGQQIVPGGIIDKPMPLDVSNVMLVCPTCQTATRVGVIHKEIKGETVRVRVCKRDGCGQEIDR